MRNINLKGVNAETVAGILILFIAIVNAILQMFGINTLPIENDDVTGIISAAFLIITTLYNTWKNRNLTSASQVAQDITNAIKTGELLENDVRQLVEKLKAK